LSGYLTSKSVFGQHSVAEEMLVLAPTQAPLHTFE